MSRDNEFEIIKAIGKGDEKAFADLYCLYENRIYRFIKIKLNDSFEAADILHETFLAVWQNAGKFKGQSKVSTWLFGIAHNKAVDRIRKKKPMLIDEENFPEIADTSPDAVSCLLTEENNQHIRFCLEKLKSAHKAVIELAFFDDMNYGEIAEILACPENTVKTRMFHAKQNMKHCLQQRMGDTQ